MRTKEIPGFRGYHITEEGEVMSKKRKGYALRSAMDKLCYCRQPIRSDDGKVVCKYVHRLVAEAFVARVEGCGEVDHIDGNPYNNAASNLRWVTHRENIVSAMKRKGNWLRGNGKRVEVTRINPETGERTKFSTIRAASEACDEERVKGSPEAGPGVSVPWTNYAGNISKASRNGKVAYDYLWERW